MLVEGAPVDRVTWEERRHACVMQAAPDLSALDVSVTAEDCARGLRRCAHLLRAASCAMRRPPGPFVPPEIHCSGTPTRLDEEPGPAEDPRGATPAARLAHRLPPCIPSCGRDYVAAREENQRRYDDWATENQQRIEECGQVP